MGLSAPSILYPPSGNVAKVGEVGRYSMRERERERERVCVGLYSRELWIGVKHKRTNSAMRVTEAVLSELQDHLDWGEFFKCCLFAHAVHGVLAPNSQKKNSS